MKFNLVLAGPVPVPPEVVDLPETPQLGTALATHDGGEIRMLIVQGVLVHLSERRPGVGRVLDHIDLIVAHLPKPGEKQIILPGR